MSDTEQPVCSACFEPREHDDLDDDGLCSKCREHSRICSKCRGLFDIASEGSDEDPTICYGCEEYLWCPSCGVELCKPSDCPDGNGFGCASCGGAFVRKGSEMVPRARPVTLANPAGDFDPDAPDPGDTAALMRLRGCIDEYGVWPTEQSEQDGNYELCVRFMAEEIRRLQNCVTQAERSRYSSTTLAAKAHFVAKHLAELTEPAARLYELDRSLTPITMTPEMLKGKRDG